MTSRQALWLKLKKLFGIAEGQIVPKWMIFFRALLFPIDTLFWLLNRYVGYQFADDTFLIGGARFSYAGLRMLAKADGETYRVRRVGDVVEFVRIAENEKELYRVRRVGDAVEFVRIAVNEKELLG
jgi:hypothetical protein